MSASKAALLSLLLLGAIASKPAFAAANDSSEPPAAAATSVATGEFDYDEARVTFSVTIEGQDVTDIAAKLAKKATGLVDTMKANGLTDSDLRVSGPTISVRYATIRSPNGLETIDRQKIDGFSGYMATTVRIKDFNKIGKVISDGVKLGAAISGPNFSLSTTDEKLAGLAVEATKAALANAKAMIEAAGKKPGRVLAIRADNGGGPVPFTEAPIRAMAMAAQSPDLQIPVNPGKAMLSKSVTVTVEILER